MFGNSLVQGLEAFLHARLEAKLDTQLSLPELRRCFRSDLTHMRFIYLHRFKIN